MKLLLLFLPGLIPVCFSAHFLNFIQASKAVSIYQYNHGFRKHNNDPLHNIRLKLYQQDRLKFASESDTLFFLEAFQLESGHFTGRIWNSVNTATYSFSGSQLKETKDNFFSKYMVHLVQRWDITSIRKAEQESLNFSSNASILATRVIASGKKLKIDCVSFKDFFKLGRDASSK